LKLSIVDAISVATEAEICEYFVQKLGDPRTCGIADNSLSIESVFELYICYRSFHIVEDKISVIRNWKLESGNLFHGVRLSAISLPTNKPPLSQNFVCFACFDAWGNIPIFFLHISLLQLWISNQSCFFWIHRLIHCNVNISLWSSSKD